MLAGESKALGYEMTGQGAQGGSVTSRHASSVARRVWWPALGSLVPASKQGCTSGDGALGRRFSMLLTHIP